MKTRANSRAALTKVDPELLERITSAVDFGDRYGRLAVSIDLPDVKTILALLTVTDVNTR